MEGGQWEVTTAQSFLPWLFLSSPSSAFWRGVKATPAFS